MAASAIGFSNSGGFNYSVSSGTGREIGSESNLRDTISRLEQERDKYQKENEQSKSELLDNKINKLENRIDNLQKRLDKMRAKEDNGECETCKNRSIRTSRTTRAFRSSLRRRSARAARRLPYAVTSTSTLTVIRLRRTARVRMSYIRASL